MKVLQVNCVYPLGSTGKIVHEIHKGLLADGTDSLVCYGRGARCQEPGVYKTCPETYAKGNNLWSRITGLPYGGCFFSTTHLISKIKKEQPDVVHLHCINGYFVNIYRLIHWLNRKKIKTVITHHAEFYYTANCSYAYECDKWMSGCGHCPKRRAATKSFFFDRTAASFAKMKKAFQGFEDRLISTAVSPWVLNRVKQSPIFAGVSNRLILNGVNEEIFCQKKEGRSETIQETIQKIDGTHEKLIFHATASFDDDPAHRKGGWAVLELARRMQNLPVKFCVACGNQNVKGNIPENVILLGNVQDQNLLADYYRAADLTLLTSKRETFSMPCAESLCCGTPMVGFQAGAPELIALSDYSEFVEYGDIDALEAVVKKWLERTDLDKAGIGKTAVSVYSEKKMVQSYLDLYRELVGEEKNAIRTMGTE